MSRSAFKIYETQRKNLLNEFEQFFDGWSHCECVITLGKQTFLLSCLSCITNLRVHVDYDALSIKFFIFEKIYASVRVYLNKELIMTM